MVKRVKTVQESDLRMLGSLARNIQRVLPVTQADIDAAAALGKGWVVWKVFEVSDPLDNLRGGTQLIIRQNSIQPGQNVRRVIFVSGPGGQTVVIRGTDYIVLPDAIADSLTYVKAFGGTEQRNLPDGYTQLEYIVFDATQVIDTGFTPDNNSRIESKCYRTGEDCWFYGASPSNPRVTLYHSRNGTCRWGNQSLSSVGFVVDTEYTIVEDKNGLTINGVNTPWASGTAGDFTCDRSLTIGNNNGSTETRYFAGNFYYMKIYNNGVLARDFVPCKNASNVVGLYDKVNGVFYTDAGLVAGTVAVPTPDAPMDIVSNNGVLKARHQSGLPWGYTLLDFVTNASGTRINTGIYDDIDDFSIEIRVEPSGGSWYICQSRANGGAQIYGLSGGSSGAKIAMGVGLSGGSASSDISRDPSHIYTVIGSHKNGVTTLYVKDETTGDEDTQTTTYDTNDFVPAPTAIGVWGQSSNTVNANNDIYYLKIRKGGVLVADYVPCQYNGENGFYDFVSQSFFGATVGTINAGNPVSDPMEIYADGTVETIEDTIGNTATAEMLLKVDDYQDEHEILSGVVTRNVGVKVLDGTEGVWSKINNSFGSTPLFTDRKSGKNTLFCSHFQYDTGSTSGIPDGCVGTASTTKNVYFRNDALSTVEDWEQWLADQYAAGTPVIVIYPLATPTTESVTGQTLQVTGGDNVLEITQASLTGLELEAQYNAAVSLTIQEVEDANLDNNVTVTIQ